MMGSRARESSGVDERFVSARRDSNVARRSVGPSSWSGGASKERRGRIAVVAERGLEPPNMWEGLVEMRIRARA